MNDFADTTAAVTGSLLTLLLIVGVYVWTALALAAVFRKSGEAGWQGWVPILNQMVLFRLGGQNPMFLLFYLLPGVGAVVVWVFQILACHRVNAEFRLGTGMTVLAALLFPVWASILGFGSARWIGEEQAGPRRTGDTAPPVAPTVAAPAFTATPAGGPRLEEQPYAPLGEVPFQTRSTHVSAPDPLFSTSSEAVAPPAPAPNRPTPFAPTAPIADAGSGPVAPRAVRAGSPVPPPPGGWSSAAVDDDLREDSEDVGAPVRRRGSFGAPPVSEDSGEVTGAVPGAPAPMSAIPADPEPDLPPVTRIPATSARPSSAEPWAPTRSPLPDLGGFAESSGPVSAIVGAPDAGSPRSARSSVSAQNKRPEIPEELVEETVIARRRRTDWSLVTPSGDFVAIGAEVVLLGRRPTPDSAHPGAQLIGIDDGTVSKTHARLELRDEKWWITDLDSTNGVIFATLMGTEVEATPGVAIEAGDRFLLGDAEVKLVRSSE